MNNEAQEIERKFLVKPWGEWKEHVYDSFRIRHVYLANTPDVAIRITVKDKSENGLYPSGAKINIKYPRDGLSRHEVEYDLGYILGGLLYEDLALKGEFPSIVKVRHLTTEGEDWKYEEGPCWEIDVFETKGLEQVVLAEIELPTADTNFDRPSWLGEEVTNDPQYYNSIMAETHKVRRPIKTDEKIDKNFIDNWSFLLNKDGSVNLDLLKYELADFSHLINEVPKIYDHIAGLSKHMYFADTIISEADRRYWEFHRDIILDDIEGMETVEEVRQYLKDSG